MEHLNNINWHKIENKNFECIENRTGVYIISTKQKIDKKYAVNYIGQSKNLHDRIVEHFSSSEENIELKNHIKKGY